LISKKYIFAFKGIAVGFVLTYLSYKIATSNVLELLKTVKISNVYALVLSVILVVFNWGFEAKKWQLLLADIKSSSFLESFKAVLSGLSTGLLTPNRLGNFIGRLAYLKKENHNQATVNTLVGNLAQFVITILFGLIGLLILTYFQFKLQNMFLIIGLSILFVGIGLLVYFKTSVINFKPVNKLFSQKTKQSIQQVNDTNLKLKNQVLLLSFLRYSIFCIQYFLLFKTFGLSIVSVYLFALIAVVFLITTLIPSLLFGKLFVRESVAIFIFSMANIDVSLILIVASMLWLINLAIPAIVGSVFWLKQKQYA